MELSTNVFEIKTHIGSLLIKLPINFDSIDLDNLIDNIIIYSLEYLFNESIKDRLYMDPNLNIPISVYNSDYLYYSQDELITTIISKYYNINNINDTIINAILDIITNLYNSLKSQLSMNVDHYVMAFIDKNILTIQLDCIDALYYRNFLEYREVNNNE